MSRFTVLVLGGSGVFGRRICRCLAAEPKLRVVVAARDVERIDALVDELRQSDANARVDGYALNLPADLGRALQACSADLVIHTAGPFQGQGYEVARRCIEAGVHYIDLADGREFVCGFAQLNEMARRAGVLAVSGASSVPGLSSTVFAHLRRELESVEDVAIAIAAVMDQPRGPAVVEAVLGYVGKPMPWLRDGRWGRIHGWQDLRRRSFSGPGLRTLPNRWLAACDVPDLALLPRHEPELRNVSFHAGLEVAMAHLGLWAASWLVRCGLLRSLAPFAKGLSRLASWMAPLGSDSGGMLVELTGSGPDRKARTLTWTLVAEQGDGPWVPTIPAIILAKGLARGTVETRGAFPCFNLFALEDFDREVRALNIETAIERNGVEDRKTANARRLR